MFVIWRVFILLFILFLIALLNWITSGGKQDE